MTYEGLGRRGIRRDGFALQCKKRLNLKTKPQKCCDVM
jgi:hypothetical protein